MNEEIINNFLKLENTIKSDQHELKTQTIFHQIYHQLLTFGVENNIKGNLWKKYILFLLSKDKNPFSLNCERTKTDLSQSFKEAAVHDCKILLNLYNLELKEVAKKIESAPTEAMINFTSPKDTNNPQLNRLDKIVKKAESPLELTTKLATYYSKYGTGKLGQYKAFRWSKDKGLIGVENPDPITFKELIAYQKQQQQLIKNTESFLEGHQANNVLLVGDSGTGKSSSIKALMNEYYQDSLRIIELAKYQMKELPKLLEKLTDRGLYFIIFMDDLSFEDFEIEYKYMKAIMEGGLEVKPNNVVFYATSNRSHLISEKWQDRDEQKGEIHPQEAKQEKLSLAQRFGVTIRYQAPNQERYLSIVKKLAQQQGIKLAPEKLIKQAKQWALWQNGRSGRTVQQFINSLK